MRARGRARDMGDDEEDDEGEDLFNDNMLKWVTTPLTHFHLYAARHGEIRDAMAYG